MNNYLNLHPRTKFTKECYCYKYCLLKLSSGSSEVVSVISGKACTCQVLDKFTMWPCSLCNIYHFTRYDMTHRETNDTVLRFRCFGKYFILTLTPGIINIHQVIKL